MEDKTIKALQDRFSTVHPLIFYRSKEKSKTVGELFDILDTIPTQFPIVWNEEAKCWTSTQDLFQAKNFKGK